jgi:hypothetical protein
VSPRPICILLNGVRSDPNQSSPGLRRSTRDSLSNGPHLRSEIQLLHPRQRRRQYRVPIPRSKRRQDGKPLLPRTRTRREARLLHPRRLITRRHLRLTPYLGMEVAGLASGPRLGTRCMSVPNGTRKDSDISPWRECLHSFISWRASKLRCPCTMLDSYRERGRTLKHSGDRRMRDPLGPSCADRSLAEQTDAVFLYCYSFYCDDRVAKSFQRTNWKTIFGLLEFVKKKAMDSKYDALVGVW